MNYSALSKKSAVAILVLTLIAGCATVPRQNAAAKAKAISTLNVGDVVEISYEFKNGWGTSRCTITAKDNDGVMCGGQRFLFDEATSIKHFSKVSTYALIPLTPILVGGWIGAMTVCQFVASCNPDASTADCPISGNDIVALGKTTKVIAITELHGAVSEYKSDGDPGTLELVFLKDKKNGPSRVSDDGEVIFLAPKITDKEQQELITQALYIRAVLRKGLTARCSGPWTHP